MAEEFKVEDDLKTAAEYEASHEDADPEGDQSPEGTAAYEAEQRIAEQRRDNPEESLAVAERILGNPNEDTDLKAATLDNVVGPLLIGSEHRAKALEVLATAEDEGNATVSRHIAKILRI